MVKEVADVVPGGALMVDFIDIWILVQHSLSLVHMCRKRKEFSHSFPVRISIPPGGIHLHETIQTRLHYEDMSCKHHSIGRENIKSTQHILCNNYPKI